MGVCTSTNQNLITTNTTYFLKSNKEDIDDFEPPCSEDEK